MSLTKTRKTVECGILLSIAMILGLLRLVELPFGGSVTPAAMLPVAIIAYRHGPRWGITAGLIFGTLQLLTGLKTLSFVTTWQSAVAVILLDYLLAYGGMGLAGVFRKTPWPGRLSLAAGCGLGCLLRYACHVIAGATVWAGLSIPDRAAVAYSLIYNATYMIPETLVLLAAAYAAASLLDFRREQPGRPARGEKPDLWRGLALAVAAGGVIFDVVALFARLQDPQTGAFRWEGLQTVPWLTMLAVTAGAALAAVLLWTLPKRRKKV